MGGLNTNNGGKAIPISLQQPVPTSEGSRAVQFTFDFSGGTTQIPLNINSIDYGVSLLQTAFIDNSNNGSAVTISVSGANQKMTCPPYSQGYFPLMSAVGNSINLIASSAGNVAVNISLINIYIDLMIWTVQAPGTVAGTVQVAGSVVSNPATGVYTNRGGAIAAANTSQQLAAANGARKRLFIQNPSTAAGQNIAAAESLFVNFTNNAGVNDGASIELAPGQSIDLSGTVTTELVNVVAATLNHRYIAKEM